MGRMMYILLRTLQHVLRMHTYKSFEDVLWTWNKLREIAAPALVAVVGNIEDLRDNAHGWYSVICYME